MINCTWLSAAVITVHAPNKAIATGYVSSSSFTRSNTLPPWVKTLIEDFLNNLAVNKSVSASTQAQALNALVFLNKHVLQQDVGDMEDLRRIKRFKNIPTVLNREEVKSLLVAMQGQSSIMASLLYGEGLRIHECVALRDLDLDLNYYCLR